MRETTLTTDDLIWPIFVTEGTRERTEITSMPGVARLSVDLAVKAAEDAAAAGLPAIALFPHTDPALRDSARLTAQAWHDELCAGLHAPPPALSLFPVAEGQSHPLVTLQGIPVKSICAHHLLPFVGTATVGYVPEATLCGISNLSRVVDYCARKLQMQEALTDEIAEFLQGALAPRGVGIFIQATHLCMQLRGVNHPGQMTTSAFTGCLRDDAVLRGEFMALAGSVAVTA